MNQLQTHSLAAAASGTERPALRVALVKAGWHADMVGAAVAAVHAEFRRRGRPGDAIDEYEVAGAFEIPLQAKRLAASGRYDAVIACGFVVDGGIYRHEFVAAAVIDGLMRVQLDADVPVLSAVLTPQHFHEHGEHVAFFRRHMATKGAEVANACIATVEALRRPALAAA